MATPTQLPEAWEAGYIELDTYEEAVRKNGHRLRQCGLFEHLQDRMVVLDLCCGRGTTFGVLKGISVQVIGMDISLPLLQQARSHGGQHVVCADSCRVPLQDSTVDVVIIQGGLHHFWDDQLRLVLEEIDRVLKPNGYFAFSEPCNTWVLRLYVRLIDGPLANLTRYTRNWRMTLEHERGTYINWMKSQRSAVVTIASRMELARFRRGLVTMFGLARSKKPSH